jgi:hypothetical protein
MGGDRACHRFGEPGAGRLGARCDLALSREASWCSLHLHNVPLNLSLLMSGADLERDRRSQSITQGIQSRPEIWGHLVVPHTVSEWLALPVVCNHARANSAFTRPHFRENVLFHPLPLRRFLSS